MPHALSHLILPPPPAPTTPFDGKQYQTYLADCNQLIHNQIATLGLSAVSVIDESLRLRTQAVDAVLVAIFTALHIPATISLFAVGGYGRRELYPNSDVDILLIGKNIDQHQSAIELFVASLWDIGITPAILVQDEHELDQAVREQTLATTLLDSRFVVGQVCPNPKTTVINTWQIGDFYAVKLSEAKARHLSHNATEHNLEPHLKNTVGGLRDLHILGWLFGFYFDKTFDELSDTPLISQSQLDSLCRAKAFLGLIRHHLHTLTARYEDRLLFEHQKTIATLLGFQDHPTHPNHGAEQLMKHYYQHAMTVASLSELLCEYFYEHELLDSDVRTPIDDDFYQSNDNGVSTIGVFDLNVFDKKPETLLKIFVIMGQLGIQKIRASTLNALYLSARQIDDAYRQNPTHKALFLANLQETTHLFHRLCLMKRYGVLARYLPVFGQIMGLMQYDLFHRYTVDAHTLLLIEILHRFTDESCDAYQQKFDLVSQIYAQIHRKDILVIAALFHDIAKGRGGDHSELGAVEAHEFCVGHGMSVADANFVSWLVRHHLTMSLTAQKQDIYDPNVIGNFARLTSSITHLNHLYVLTVADMNATNNQLWNSWRASLLKRLYLSTHQVLNLGDEVMSSDHLIASRKNKAKRLMTSNPDGLWEHFGEEYFLTQKYVDIAWQTQAILDHLPNYHEGKPIIVMREHTDLALDAVQLFICTQDSSHLFTTTVCVLDSLGLSVLGATILTAMIDGVPSALDNYILIDRFAKRDEKGGLTSDFLTDKQRQHDLINRLTQAFCGQAVAPYPTLGVYRHLKHFTVPTQIHFDIATAAAHEGHHLLSLITKDRPALLATIGQVFSGLDIAVHGAKITTMGERAEDMFYISDKGGKLLDEDKLCHLRATLLEVLS